MANDESSFIERRGRQLDYEQQQRQGRDITLEEAGVIRLKKHELRTRMIALTAAKLVDEMTHWHDAQR